MRQFALTPRWRSSAWRALLALQMHHKFTERAAIGPVRYVRESLERAVVSGRARQWSGLVAAVRRVSQGPASAIACVIPPKRHANPADAHNHMPRGLNPVAPPIQSCPKSGIYSFISSFFNSHLLYSGARETSNAQAHQASVSNFQTSKYLPAALFVLTSPYSAPTRIDTWGFEPHRIATAAHLKTRIYQTLATQGFTKSNVWREKTALLFLSRRLKSHL